MVTPAHLPLYREGKCVGVVAKRKNNRTMKYIATILFLLMTLSFVVCGFLLWKRRHEPNDYSRTIQALLSWMAAFFTSAFIFRTWAGTTTADGAFFEPEHTFVPLLMQVTFFLYPLEASYC